MRRLEATTRSSPHLIARLRPVAYQKTVVMSYLDNLIAWGDQLFRRDTIESINEATQLYILAAEILGAAPDEDPGAGRRAAADRSTRSRRQPRRVRERAGRDRGAFTPTRPDAWSSRDADDAASRCSQLPTLLYFCIPPNDKLLGYWDTVADRLFKIRHCMNIEGVVRAAAAVRAADRPGAAGAARRRPGVDLGSVLSATSARRCRTTASACWCRRRPSSAAT